MYVCICVVALAVGLRRGPGGGGGGGGSGESAPFMVCATRAGREEGGVSPFVTSILRHKCGNACRVKIHSFYYRDLIRKKLFYLNE